MFAWPRNASQYQGWESSGSPQGQYYGAGPKRPPRPPPPAFGMNKVGNQTNSNDPQSVNSRVFVGNLNTYIVNKDQVERMFLQFGRVHGISMHKGFAFVQFTNPFDARNAVAGMEHRVVCGQVLDCNIASEPKPHQSTRKRQNAAGANTQDWNGGNQRAPANKKPRMAAQKAVDEPEAFLCYMCKDRFTLSWDLLQHIQSTHNITLYEAVAGDTKDFTEDQNIDDLNGEQGS